MARLLDTLPRGPMRYVEVDDEGRPIAAGEMEPTAELRQHFEADAAVAAQRTGLRRGPRRLTDALLARECHNYIEWTEAGRSVAELCESLHMSAATLENHRREAMRRGLFKGSGKQGKPGGTLTAAGLRALTESESEG